MKLLDFELEERGESLLVTFPNLPVAHATSTRCGGFSRPPFDSLNLGLMSGDDLETVRRNRARFSEMVGFPVRQNLQMTHGVTVVHLEQLQQSLQPQEGDALITAHPEIGLSLTTADCVPLFFYDPEVPAIGLAHAGWRGTVAGIAARTVEAMTEQLGARPERLQVGLGPCLAACCFEVGPDVQEPFLSTFGEQEWIRPLRPGKWTIDLHQANLEFLRGAGVLPEHIRCCNLCTSCRADLFYSYRRDQGKTGRLLSAIALQAGAAAPDC